MQIERGFLKRLYLSLRSNVTAIKKKIVELLCKVKKGTDFAYLSPLMSHYLIVMIHKFCVYFKPLLSAHITDFFF